MNQRLMVILAIILMIIGGAGLLLYQDDEKDKIKEIQVYTAIKAIEKGHAFSKDNIRVSAKSLSSAQDLSLEEMPNIIAGYQATQDIANGTVITGLLSEIIPKETVSLKKGLFIYYLPVAEEDSVPLNTLKKGDALDIYLRYYSVDEQQGGRRLVNKEGNQISKVAVRWKKIIENRRFFSLTRSTNNEILPGSHNREKIVGIEAESNDVIKLSAVKHLGEIVPMPAAMKLKDNHVRPQIPAMITELRGRSSR